MKRKNVIRIGDFVTVKVLRKVERVGYPLSYYEACELAEEDPRFKQIADILKGPADSSGSLFSNKMLNFRVERKLIALLGYQILLEKKFGGIERQIFYHDFTPFEQMMYKGKTNKLEVLGKRVVKTGLYNAPCSGYNSYDGEPWYEPGGLENEQTHILLRTEIGELHSADVEKVVITAS